MYLKACPRSLVPSHLTPPPQKKPPPGSPPELESPNEKALVGVSARWGEAPHGRPLSPAVHAALAPAALKPWVQAPATPTPRGPPRSPNPIGRRVRSSVLGPPPRPPRGSHCRSQRGGAGLPGGPRAPPVALKLENKALAEGAERPLQGSGGPAAPSGRQPAAPRQPGRTCSARPTDATPRLAHPGPASPPAP